MISLSNISKYIQRFKNRNFRKQIRQEKRQKYLFREDEGVQFFGKRNAFMLWKKQKLLPFNNFITYSKDLFEKYLFETKLIGIIGGVLLSLSGYIIFFSPYFEISPSNVLIESLSPGLDLNIAYRSIEDYYGHSILFLDEEDVAYSLKQSLKNIAHIRIDKLYPNGLKILITSSPIPYRATIYGIENRVWGLSENGVLIPRGAENNSGSAYKDIEIISDPLRSETFLDYKAIIEDNSMYRISGTVKLLSEQFPDFTIKKIRYFMIENEIHLLLTSGTILITTVGMNPEISEKENKELERARFISLLRYIEEGRNEIIAGSLYYIDVRIPRKLFICRDKILCKDNLISIYGDIYSRN